MKQVILILFVFSSLVTMAQTTVKTVQPVVMVLPWVKEGQDIRSTIEDDPNMRTAINVVQNAFLKRGYQTADFINTFRSKVASAQMTRDAQNSLKNEIIANSGADIKVEIDPQVLSGAGCQSVRINMSANDVYSGMNMAAMNPESMCFNVDVGKLMEKALEAPKDQTKGIESFLNQLNESFGRIVEDGRDINLHIVLKQGASRKFTQDIDDDFNTINTIIEAWGLKIAFKGYARSIKSDVEFEFKPIRVPLRDPATNANFNIEENLIKPLRRELKAKGITTESAPAVGGVYYLYVL